jgi:hypothetical protein
MSQHDAEDDDGSMLAAAAWDGFLRSYFASDDSHTPRRPAGALGDTGAEVDVTVGLITTQPIWRRKELLAELENFVGPLSEKERELVDAEVDGNMGSGDDFDEIVTFESIMRDAARLGLVRRARPVVCKPADVAFRLALRAAALLEASIKSAIASACARSILSFKKARSVNSPGCATRRPGNRA